MLTDRIFTSFVPLEGELNFPKKPTQYCPRHLNVSWEILHRRCWGLPEHLL